MKTHLCEFLAWDSNFFGIRIARVNQRHLNANEVEPVLEWCKSHAIDCLYFLADTQDAGATGLVRDFSLTDIRIRFELPLRLEAPSGSNLVRPFQSGDLPALRALARVSHRDSRFYYDGRFPVAKCDELYDTWIQRSAGGWADAVFVAEWEGRPAGYISCHLSGSDGSIGLIAVDEQARGKGLGRALVESSIAFFRERGMDRALVVTQGRNIASQRLYQRCGFLTESVHYWFHRWFQGVAERRPEFNLSDKLEDLNTPPA
jgi:dTDP-4-amino-4,6-dideoxy-D-galactose acyltransferase